MKNAADEFAIGGLHSKVAKVLNEQLDGKPLVNADGEVIGTELDPRWMTAAITFLNHNKATYNPFISDQVSEISEKLKDRTKRFAVIKDQAVEAAKRAVANG
jgi:hypothetical protein